MLISSKYISAAIPVLVGLLWIIQKFYLRTSKQLRLMDIEAKAPLSALMLETIKGIVAIRAFGRTGEFSACNTGHLDHSQRAMYMLLSVQVWLKMILDFVVCFLAILVVSIAVATRSSQSAGIPRSRAGQLGTSKYHTRSQYTPTHQLTPCPEDIPQQ